MAEYINRDELLRHYEEYYCKPCREKGYDYHGVKCRACGTGDAIETAEGIPAADVRENVQGKWIHTIDDVYDFYKCSVCGLEIEAPGGVPTESFCPNCGADMRSGEEMR